MPIGQDRPAPGVRIHIPAANLCGCNADVATSAAYPVEHLSLILPGRGRSITLLLLGMETLS